VVVEAAPSSPFEISEPDLLLGDFVTASSFQRAAFLIDNAWHAPLMFVGEISSGASVGCSDCVTTF
jgi:hypothetical protein